MREAWKSARDRAAVLILLLVAVAGFRASPACGAEGSADAAADMAAQIDSLREQGRYSDGLARARQLLTLRQNDPKTKPYDLADARWVVRTMEFALSLPESERKDLAEADRLSAKADRTAGGGDYALAEVEARRALEIRRKILGEEHPDVASSLNNLALLLRTRGDYAGAEPLLRESLTMFRKVLGDEHPNVAATMSNLGSLLKDRGNYAGAEPLARESLAMRRKLLGEEHPSVATGLNNLGTILCARGDLAGAEPLLREALAMWRKLLGDEHPKVATGISNLATLLSDRGDYAGAEPLCRESLALRRKILGEEHPDVAKSLNNLANLLTYRGDYVSAEPLCRESLAMRRKLLGETHPEVANGLANLAGLLQLRGDLAGAEPLLRESLAMQRKLLGEEHPEVATIMNNLAALLKERGNFAEAESLYQESLAMRRKLLRMEHPDVATSLSNLATLLWARGDYAGAEPLLREALAMRRKLLGAEHPDVANNLTNLAGLLQSRGDYAGAEPLFRESLAMQRKLLGEQHPYVARSLNNLARPLVARGDYAGAEPVLTEAAAIFEKARLRAGRGIDRSTFLKQSPYPVLAATRLALGKKETAWPAVERSQGRVLADLLLTTANRMLSSEEARQEDSLRLNLGDEGRQLAVYRRAARTDSSEDARSRVEESRTKLLQAEARWGAFEQEIARKHPVTEGQAFDLARVQAALRPEEAIIGWLEVKNQEGCSRLPSWGYVIRNQGPVEWRPLPGSARRSGVEAAWEKVTGASPPSPGSTVNPEEPPVSAFLREVSRRPVRTDLPNREARALYGERLSPLMDCLKGVKYLIVIPSGEMLGIPAEALVLNGRGNMLGDRFAVSYTPSATIHTWLREKEKERTEETLAGGDRGLGHSGAVARGARCLAVGDPPFCVDQLAAMESGATEASPEALSLVETPAHVTFRPVSGVPEPFRGEEGSLVRSALAGNREVLQSLERLPLTRSEVTMIAGLYGGDSRLLLGAEATEQELARMAAAGELKQYQILHFATHALIDDERPENSALILSQVDLPNPVTAAMAGTRVYDGCVSAGEVVREWKIDADLVTLSACETALGKKVAGEGYIGLAHAFLQAGARSLLVSLWKVEDRSTSMLMERFYENLRGGYQGVRGTGPRRVQGSPMSKAEALQEAKRWLREWKDDRGHRPYAHPFFWAGFVLMGSAD
jgi:CHAT domain-containing protein/Flp pilus assembly protein TadD